jgi:hypothetical protein
MGLDTGVISAIEYYFKWGLPPGSFTAGLLSGACDPEHLLNRAHPYIRDIVDNHVQFVNDCIPLCCRGENFETWKGYEREIVLDPSLELTLYLAIPATAITRKWMEEVKIQQHLKQLTTQESNKDVLARS